MPNKVAFVFNGLKKFNVLVPVMAMAFPLSNWIDVLMGNVYCPFHYDVNHKSAKLHIDDDDIERLWCYSCRKQFTGYDYVVKVLKEDPVYYLRRYYSDDAILDMINVVEGRKPKHVFDLVKVLVEYNKKNDGSIQDLFRLVYQDVLYYG